jgi:hypothetical protein
MIITLLMSLNEDHDAMLMRSTISMSDGKLY